MITSGDDYDDVEDYYYYDDYGEEADQYDYAEYRSPDPPLPLKLATILSKNLPRMICGWGCICKNIYGAQQRALISAR